MIDKTRAMLVLMLLVGCGPLNLRTNTAKQQKLAAVEVSAFRDVRSMDEQDRLLKKLKASENAQQQAEAIIQGWGQHGSWHDLAVVRFILEEWPSPYGRHLVLGKDHERFDSHRLFDVATGAIKTKPDLAFQVYWYQQWRYGPSDFASLMRHMELGSTGCVRIPGDRFPLALCFLGVASGIPDFPDGSLVGQLSWATLDADALLMNQFILSQRPFLKYDHQLGRYVVDQEAMKANRYLSPEEQAASPRPTPLPNWDSDVVPTSPAAMKRQAVEEELAAN